MFILYFFIQIIYIYSYLIDIYPKKSIVDIDTQYNLILDEEFIENEDSLFYINDENQENNIIKNIIIIDKKNIAINLNISKSGKYSVYLNGKSFQIFFIYNNLEIINAYPLTFEIGKESELNIILNSIQGYQDKNITIGNINYNIELKKCLMVYGIDNIPKDNKLKCFITFDSEYEEMNIYLNTTIQMKEFTFNSFSFSLVSITPNNDLIVGEKIKFLITTNYNKFYDNHVIKIGDRTLNCSEYDKNNITLVCYGILSFGNNKDDNLTQIVYLDNIDSNLKITISKTSILKIIEIFPSILESDKETTLNIIVNDNILYNSNINTIIIGNNTLYNCSVPNVNNRSLINCNIDIEISNKNKYPEILNVYLDKIDTGLYISLYPKLDVISISPSIISSEKQNNFIIELNDINQFNDNINFFLNDTNNNIELSCKEIENTNLINCSSSETIKSNEINKYNLCIGGLKLFDIFVTVYPPLIINSISPLNTYSTVLTYYNLTVNNNNYFLNQKIKLGNFPLTCNKVNNNISLLNCSCIIENNSLDEVILTLDDINCTYNNENIFINVNKIFLINVNPTNVRSYESINFTFSGCNYSILKNQKIYLNGTEIIFSNIPDDNKTYTSNNLTFISNDIIDKYYYIYLGLIETSLKIKITPILTAFSIFPSTITKGIRTKFTIRINSINLYNDNTTNISLGNSKFEKEDCITYTNKYYIACYKLISDENISKIQLYIDNIPQKNLFVTLLDSIKINQIEPNLFQSGVNTSFILKVNNNTNLHEGTNISLENNRLTCKADPDSEINLICYSIDTIISDIKIPLSLYIDGEKTNLTSIIIPNINVYDISPININYGGTTIFDLLVDNSDYLNDNINFTFNKASNSTLNCKSITTNKLKCSGAVFLNNKEGNYLFVNNKKQNDVYVFVDDKFIINDISPINSSLNSNTEFILSVNSAYLHVNHNISFGLNNILNCSILSNENNSISCYKSIRNSGTYFIYLDGIKTNLFVNFGTPTIKEINDISPTNVLINNNVNYILHVDNNGGLNEFIINLFNDSYEPINLNCKASISLNYYVTCNGTINNEGIYYLRLNDNIQNNLIVNAKFIPKLIDISPKQIKINTNNNISLSFISKPSNYLINFHDRDHNEYNISCIENNENELELICLTNFQKSGIYYLYVDNISMNNYIKVIEEIDNKQNHIKISFIFILILTLIQLF